MTIFSSHTESFNSSNGAKTKRDHTTESSEDKLTASCYLCELPWMRQKETRKMAPNAPLPPTCERRSLLTDHEIFLLDNATSSSGFVYEDPSLGDYSRPAMIFGNNLSTIDQHFDTDKHASPMPCCTTAYCDFDFHPTAGPPNVCTDGSACFDFACLDESCLEYAHTPCQEPGCAQPSATECDDPHCEETSTMTSCLDCLDESHENCTTCCMADICPNPAHSHLPKHHHPLPNEYVPWNQIDPGFAHHTHQSICSSSRSSVEPRLSAALHSSLSGFDSSPILTDARSTPATTDTFTLDTPARGGHRRLQGASARQLDGTYACNWIIDTTTALTCGHVFADPQGLHEHIQANHFAGSASNHPCQWLGCDSGIFNTKPKLARHLHSHTEFKPHKCDYPGCDLGFVTQQQRDVHRKKHTGEKPYACPMCKKAFAYMDLLKSHLRSGVHGQADKKFACNICGEGFSDSSNRTKHTKSVHDSNYGVPCPDNCGYVDTRREKLRIHCEKVGHGLHLLQSTREWEDYFNREQNLRRPSRGHKKKRSAHQAGFDVVK